MNRRHSKRITVVLHGELIVKDVSYLVLISNLSEKGMFLRTYPVKTTEDFIPGTTPKLKFKLPSEETLNLHGEIKWLHSDKSSSNIFMNNMGMEIIDPPQAYKEFVETLQ